MGAVQDAESAGLHRKARAVGEVHRPLGTARVVRHVGAVLAVVKDRVKGRVGTVLCECPPSLVGLLRTCAGIDTIIPFGEALPERVGVFKPAIPSHVKAWRDIWSGGHGVGLIEDVPSVADLVDRLVTEFEAARESLLALGALPAG